MNKKETVSASVIKRLPRYYRFLGELMNQGVSRISSGELAKMMKVTASQIRQDLNCFGGFGQQGYGYRVEALHDEIGRILGVDRQFKTIIIGAGNLGRAIAAHMDFKERGCELVGIFDSDKALKGEKAGKLTIRHIKELEGFCKLKKPVAAVLCIPKDNAQEIADKLVSLGIRAFWNFSHYDLSLDYDNIAVENVHLGDSLLTLTYRLSGVIDSQQS